MKTPADFIFESCENALSLRRSRQLRGAQPSLLLVSASRRNELFMRLLSNLSQMTNGILYSEIGSSHRRDADASTRDACATQKHRAFSTAKIRSFVLMLFFLAFGAPAFAEKQTDNTDEIVRVNPATRTAINSALKHLVSKQHLDGSWYIKEGLGGHAVAMTGYSLIAFMSAGNLPDQGPYKKNVAAGMQFLLDSVQPDGLFRGVSRGQYMYNHGIATVALAELYGETHSATIRPKLERLVKVILDAQNPAGGWRYTPRPTDADISVTVVQAVALRAAQEAGIAVPQDAINKAADYVSSCYNEEKGGFCYQPKGAPGFARTASAIYALQVLGKYDDPKVKAGSAYLFAHYKESGGYFGGAYGNNYAAPAQYMIGGETWRNWYVQTSKGLVESAEHEGDTIFWQEPTTGTIFSTAVNITILAMPYHFLPLYQR